MKSTKAYAMDGWGTHAYDSSSSSDMNRCTGGFNKHTSSMWNGESVAAMASTSTS